MSVKILFSDGSKEMAHNTDDLRERWELRQRIGQEEIQIESQHGYSIPYPSTEYTYRQLVSLKAVYVAMLPALQARKKALYPERLFRREHAHLSFVYAEIIAGIAEVKSLINETEDKYLFAKLKQEREQLWHYAHLLEKLLIETGIPLPPEPFEGCRQTGEVPKRKLKTQASSEDYKVLAPEA